MLVTLKEILSDAKEKKYGVGAFNAPNLETVQAVIAAAARIRNDFLKFMVVCFCLFIN